MGGPGRPFRKGQTGNALGRPARSATFASLRRLLNAPTKGEEIVRRYEQLADGAEDEKVRLEANNMLAKYRDGEPEPPPESSEQDEAEPMTPEQLAAALMPQTTETQQ